MVVQAPDCYELARLAVGALASVGPMTESVRFQVSVDSPFQSEDDKMLRYAI